VSTAATLAGVKTDHRDIITAHKAVIAMATLVAAALTVVLGVLYFFDVLEELWVLALPAIHVMALKLVAGGYYGAVIAPQVIEDRKRKAAE